MQTDNVLFTKVADAVGGVLNTKPGQVTLQSRFREDLGAESIDMIDISFEIEKATGQELDFKQVLEHVKKTSGGEVKDLTIGDLVGYLQIGHA